MNLWQDNMSCEVGASWSEWVSAIAVLEREGISGPAWVLSNILGGADPRDEFGLARIRLERIENRNRMICELRLAEYGNLHLGAAAQKLASEWKQYELREAAIDRSAGALPPRATLKRAYFWAIGKQGMHSLSARQVRNILNSPAAEDAWHWRSEIGRDT